MPGKCGLTHRREFVTYRHDQYRRVPIPLTHLEEQLLLAAHCPRSVFPEQHHFTSTCNKTQMFFKNTLESRMDEQRFDPITVTS